MELNQQYASVLTDVPEEAEERAPELLGHSDYPSVGAINQHGLQRDSEQNSFNIFNQQ